MKSKIPILFVLFVPLLLMSSSSSFHYHEYTPIFMTRADLEVSVKYVPGGRELNNPGKIYYKAPYVYVNERYKGVHVINNSDPEYPVHEGFIIVPGCIDMAVKGDIIYLDNAVDLVAFNLSTKQITERIRSVFPEPVSPANRYYYIESRPADMVLVGWKRTDE